MPRHAFRSPSKVFGCILQIFNNFFIIVVKNHGNNDNNGYNHNDKQLLQEVKRKGNI